MRTRITFPAILALCAVPCTVAAQTPTAAHEPTTVAQVVDKLVAQEQAEVQMLHQYAPLAETYIQLLRPESGLERCRTATPISLDAPNWLRASNWSL